MGLLGFFRPERDRRTAWLTEEMAWSWPLTLVLRASSISGPFGKGCFDLRGFRFTNKVS
jgi:hypothetical protein